MRASSLDPWVRSGLNENELVLPEIKSDKTQKNVTVWKSQFISFSEVTGGYIPLGRY